MNKVAGISFDERGSGGIPVFCLHGIGGNTDSFAPQLDHLARHVIAWNMPGYGDSDALPDMTFPNLAAKVCEFLDALGIYRVHLCGQSIGGMIALETAFLFPDRVASLVLIGTTSAFGGRDDSFKNKFLADRLDPLDHGRSIADLAASFVPEIVGPRASPDIVSQATRSMAAVPEKSYRDALRCLTAFDRRADVSKLDIPVCLLAGETDQNAPAATMKKMADRMPNAEYHLIEGAGHLINLEAGEETNAILESFYGGIE